MYILYSTVNLIFKIFSLVGLFWQGITPNLSFSRLDYLNRRLTIATLTCPFQDWIILTGGYLIPIATLTCPFQDVIILTGGYL